MRAHCLSRSISPNQSSLTISVTLGSNAEKLSSHIRELSSFFAMVSNRVNFMLLDDEFGVQHFVVPFCDSQRLSSEN